MCRIEVGLSNYGFGGLIRKGHVVSIAVMPQHRRKGVAKALINKAYGRHGILQGKTMLPRSQSHQRRRNLALQEAWV